MEKFKLTPETDPRCIEYHRKAFPQLEYCEHEALRVRWMQFNNLKT